MDRARARARVRAWVRVRGRARVAASECSLVRVDTCKRERAGLVVIPSASIALEEVVVYG